MSSFYHTFFFDPLYNALIALFHILPWADAGIVVVILTIMVRFVLFPLSRKAVHTQVKMQEIGPEVEEIKKKYKDKPDEMARVTLALYREKGVNPFSGILVILIQLPIVIALYQIFLKAGFPNVDPTFLYSFIRVPENINTTFLGLIDITLRSIPLALLAAVTTYIQFVVSTRGQVAPKGNSFGDNLTRSMQTQMKYIFPVIVFFISYQISGVIALYWFTTNLFTIIQEIVIRGKLKRVQA
jgi:YidC/Oxa1 family membrane protein insertase